MKINGRYAAYIAVVVSLLSITTIVGGTFLFAEDRYNQRPELAAMLEVMKEMQNAQEKITKNAEAAALSNQIKDLRETIITLQMVYVNPETGVFDGPEPIRKEYLEKKAELEMLLEKQRMLYGK